MRARIITLALVSGLFASAITSQAQLLDHLKQKVKDKVDQHMDDGSAQPASDDSSTPASVDPTPTPAAGAPQQTSTVTAYQNYDFVPGDTVLFWDDFLSTPDGEFPNQWELIKGQGVANRQQGYESFLLTDGNYVQVKPRIKGKNYLGNQFTIEYDTFFVSGGYPLQVFFETGSDESLLAIGPSSVDYNNGADSFSLSSNLPPQISEENYENRWRHIAIAVKGRQMKVYVDQYRVFTVPDIHTAPDSILMGGLASQETPLIFRNLRLAQGGGMNMIGQKFTAAKLVVHGITFDIDKATLRPESMGTLNEVKHIFTDNPDLKFEIDGHTDNSGTSAHNLTLSQQRADAVKTQLVGMGIDASRLTTKGFGDTKPIADNSTQEGKANNRRVEFVRIN